MDAQIKTHHDKPTVGSLFAGIGGFDIGFEAAGFQTAWQVEIDPTCRAVLQDRFPHARQHEDVRTCLPALTPVDVIVGGFPCQDVSSMGKQRGLAGARTGLFFDAMHIVSTLKPVFSYLKMSPVCCFQTMAATSKQSLKRLPNAGMWDFGACWTAVISESPQNAAAYSWSQVWESCPRWTLWVMPDQWRAYLARRSRAAPGRTLNLRCLQVSPTGQVSTSRVGNIVAVADARHQMVERARASEHHGFRRGLDAANACEARAAGNAVCPPVAQWIAKKLITTFQAV